MKILILPIGRAVAYDGLKKSFTLCNSQHRLSVDPDDADIIIFAGDWSLNPKELVGNIILRKYFRKSFCYTDGDIYVPFLRGIYNSAGIGLSSYFGRVQNYSYILPQDYKNTYLNQRANISKKNLLFSFIGSSSSFVRKRLYKAVFQRQDILVEDSSEYKHWNESNKDSMRDTSQKRYVDIISQSKFSLAPRGSGRGSVRLFEIMQLGVCPVLISDRYLLPKGPNWDAFLIRVPEVSIHNLDKVLENYENESIDRGLQAREAWLAYFSPEGDFDRVIRGCIETGHFPYYIEKVIQLAFWPLMVCSNIIQLEVRNFLRRLILSIFRKLNREFPYNLNRDL